MSIRRNVAALSMPVLLSSLFQRLVSIVDIFLVGGLGAAAIAAAGLGQLLIFVVMTVFWGLATGTTVVIAHLWGAGRRLEARRAGFASLLVDVSARDPLTYLGAVLLLAATATVSALIPARRAAGVDPKTALGE